jgi:putative mRNA 3-end processing factor
LNSLNDLAKITKKGAILLGKYLCCDGFDIQRSAGAITHFHGDHIVGFEECLSTYKNIFVSELTRDLLIAVKGDWLKYRANLIAKPYLAPFDYEDERITLIPAKHVLGSTQILVETGGKKVIFTGDFRSEETVPVKADVLVIESSFGDPSLVRTYARDDAIRKLVSQTKKEASNGCVCILANRGKLQQAMNILYKADVELPFLCHQKVLRVTEAYRQHGVEVGELLPIGVGKAERIISGKQPHIAFYPLNSRVRSESIYTKIVVSEWNTTSPMFYKPAKNEYVISIPDHGDFKELMKYIEQSDPELVITENYRSGKGEIFAKHIEEKLHIKAKAMP